MSAAVFSNSSNLSSNRYFVHHLGFTRSRQARDHLLQTPDTFVRAPFPGMLNATAIVHAAPALGAGFLQYTAEMGPSGNLSPTPHQRFVFVLEGQIHLTVADIVHPLTPGGYAFLPTGTPHLITSQTAARVAVIEKPFEPIAGLHPPPLIIGQENTVPPEPLMGDPWLQVRSLLPANDRFDCAVNTMTFQPGASLPITEIHFMEHGLLMLEGGGIYRLGDCWYPVTAGDFIWMAPFCPQWFGAIGKTPARYFVYKDFHRTPRLESCRSKSANGN